MNFVNLINKLFPRCFAECQAKQATRDYFDQFDEEQKIEMTHNLCHQVGYFDLVLKVVLVLFVLQTIYIYFISRMH